MEHLICDGTIATEHIICDGTMVEEHSGCNGTIQHEEAEGQVAEQVTSQAVDQIAGETPSVVSLAQQFLQLGLDPGTNRRLI
jgi:hypothetical protein